MVHVGAAVLAELDLELHLPRRAQTPDVLAHQLLRRRNSRAATVHGDAFLEVEMDGVIPTAATIDVGPVLDFASLGVDVRDAVGVHGTRLTTVHLHVPGYRPHPLGP